MKRKHCSICGITSYFDLKYLTYDNELLSGYYWVCRCCGDKIKKREYQKKKQFKLEALLKEFGL